MKTLLALLAVTVLAFQPVRAADAPGPIIGIGTELKAVEGHPVVASVIQGSPADKAGIKPKDELVKIDGKSLAGLNLHQVARLLHGAENSPIHVTVNRDGSQKDFDLKRSVLIIAGGPQPMP